MTVLSGVQATAGPIQEFSQYAEGLFRRIQPETVVEIGPDNQLGLMSRLGGLCGRYIGVALPDDCERSKLAFSVLTAESPDASLELVAGNATELSRLVPRADVILKHNVLLDLTGDDAMTLQSFRSGRREPNSGELEGLSERFRQARVRSFAEFLKVASPGLILSFHRAGETSPMREGVMRHFGIREDQISVTPLLFDNGLARETAWDLVIVDNT